MATIRPWSSADCLAKFNRRAARTPIGTADAILDADKYDRLADAQEHVVREIAAVAPHVLYAKTPYGYYPTLISYDSQIFTFGSDENGYPVTPIGEVAIFPSLSAIPDAPWRRGFDYLDEGTQIRIPNNRTYSGPLYWRGIAATPRLSAKQEPVLFPVDARELIVIDAVLQFAREGGRDTNLLALEQDAWDRAWSGWALTWRKQFREGKPGPWIGWTSHALETV